MSGRPKIFDEEEVISKAIDVFWQNGYEASSTEALLEAMGIGKSSFYLAFKGGKRELFERAMEQRSAQSMHRVELALQNAPDKVAYLRSMFFSVIEDGSKRATHGCMLGNTIAELSNIDGDLKQRAATLLQRLEKVFYNVIRECQANGSLKTKEKPDFIARYLLTVWNGLNISVRIYPNKKILKPLIEKQLELLK